MHILFVTGEYPPLTGGVGAYTAALSRALVELGAQVSVLTTARTEIARDAEEEIGLYPLVERWGPSIWRSGARMADSLAADWVHVQYQTAAFGMNPAINLAPEWWRRTQGRHWRTAWTYHDLLIPYLFPKAGSRLRTWMTMRPAQTTGLTIVTNEGDRMRLVGRSRNLHSIPIGSNVKGVRLSGDERAAVREAFGYTNRDKVLGYFGFLNRSKGVATLVHTLHHLVQSGDDVQLLMLGDPLGASDPTNRESLAEVERLIADLGLTHRVRWSGRLEDDEVSAALNAVDVLLLPFQDGASLRRGTLMAGIANGCAIVTTTPQTPLLELANGRDLLFVAPGDVPATAHAVRTLLDDQSLADSLRVNVRARSELFTWHGIARRHLELYASLD